MITAILQGLLTFLKVLAKFIATVSKEVGKASAKISAKAGKFAAKGASKVGKKLGKQAIKSAQKAPSKLKSKLKKAGSKAKEAGLKALDKSQSSVKDTISQASDSIIGGKAVPEPLRRAYRTSKASTKQTVETTKKGMTVVKTALKPVKSALLKFIKVLLKLSVTAGGLVGTLCILVGIVLLSVTALLVTSYLYLPDTALNFYGKGKQGYEIGSQEYYEMQQEGADTAGGAGVVAPAAGDLEGYLANLANWYIANVPTYQCQLPPAGGSGKRQYYPITIVPGMTQAGDDCSAFASLYMAYVAGNGVPIGSSQSMVDPNGGFANQVKQFGWTAYSLDTIGGLSNLQAGDVLVCNPAIPYSQGHHAEIYLSPSTSFGWGSVKKSYPTNVTYTQSIRDGHIVVSDNYHIYVTVYRFTGR